MDWPEIPIERQPDFVPRHCAWRDCAEHIRGTPGYRYRRHGRHTRPGDGVARFRCATCDRTFSQKAFSTLYYLKRPELLAPIAAGLVAGSAHRQIARSLGCAPSTVTRQSVRLGQHGMKLLALALAALRGAVEEPICADHFETFEFSQDYPFGVLTAVGRRSWFVYGIDPAPHGRTGRLSPEQRRRLRERPRRERRGGYTGSFRRGLEILRPLIRDGQPLRLACDGKEDYRRAWASVSSDLGAPIELECHRNPKRGPKGSPRSPEARARDEAMFAVDQLHGLLRHTLAHQKRETIAFGRRLNAIMERLFLTSVWRDFVKGRSERKPDRRTPAMWLGLTDRPWPWERVLAKRLFPGRLTLPPVGLELYRRDWITPVLPTNARHRLCRAW